LRSFYGARPLIAGRLHAEANLRLGDAAPHKFRETSRGVSNLNPIKPLAFDQWLAYKLIRLVR
jgi:hypothetical protein